MTMTMSDIIEKYFDKVPEFYLKNFKKYTQYNYDYLCFYLVCMFSDKVDIINEIIQKYNIDVNKKDIEQNNCFNLACMSNENLNIIKFICEELKVSTTLSDYDGNSALIYASFNKNLNVLKYCIEDLGMDVNHNNIYKNNCFTVSCAFNYDIDIIKYLNKQPIKNKEYGLSNAACYNINLEIIKYLDTKEDKIYNIHKNLYEELYKHSLKFNKNIGVTKYFFDKFQNNEECFNKIHKLNSRSIMKYNFDAITFSCQKYIFENDFLLFSEILSDDFNKNADKILLDHAKDSYKNLSKLYDKDYSKYIYYKTFENVILTKDVVKKINLSTLNNIASKNFKCEPLEEPIHLYKKNFTEINDSLNKDELWINDICYKVNKEVICDECKELDFLLNYELLEDDIIKLRIENASEHIIQLYVNSFGGKSIQWIKDLTIQELIELSGIIDKFPNKNLIMDTLEYYLCEKYDAHYKIYLMNLTNRYKLYHLRLKINDVKKIKKSVIKKLIVLIQGFCFYFLLYFILC